MTHFRYKCQSKSGYDQGGEGTTELKLGSAEQTNHLLHEVAKIASTAGAPWDPFNVHLVVWAHNEPELTDAQKLLDILNTIFKPHDH